MKKYILIQLCSIGLFTALCFFTPPAVSYSLLILLCIRIYIFLHPTKGEKVQRPQNSAKALIVIDAQEAMCSKEGIYAQGKNFIESINKIIIAAQQQNQKVIYICQEFHRYDCFFCFLAFGGRLLQGTKNASLCSDLEIVSDTVLIKHEQDAFTSKKFVKYLDENKVDSISIIGLDVSACVSKTAIGAINRGYSVSIIEDGVIGKNAGVKNRVLRKLSKRGITIVS